MANNQLENIMDKNKNLSPRLKELIDEANKHAKTAEQKILDAYDYAINVDKLNPKKAAKVLKDNLSYTPQWINKFLPQEAKQIHVKKLKPLSTISDTENLNSKNIVIQNKEKEFKSNLEKLRQEKGIQTKKTLYFGTPEFNKEKTEIQELETVQNNGVNNFRLTTNFGGLTGYSIVVIKENKIVKIIPESKYLIQNFKELV